VAEAHLEDSITPCSDTTDCCSVHHRAAFQEITADCV
jgi:hypothetical protein